MDGLPHLCPVSAGRALVEQCGAIEVEKDHMTKFSRALQIYGVRPLLIMVIALVFSATAEIAAAPRGKPLSGTLTIDQVQVAWMISGNIGGGKVVQFPRIWMSSGERRFNYLG